MTCNSLANHAANGSPRSTRRRARIGIYAGYACLKIPSDGIPRQMPNGEIMRRTKQRKRGRPRNRADG